MHMSRSLHHLIPPIAYCPSLIAVDDPIEFPIVDIDEQSMNGNLGANDRAMADDVASFDDIESFVAEHAEVFVDVFRQEIPFDAEFLEPFEKLRRAGFANLTVGVADDSDFIAAFDAASKGER